MKEDVLTKLIKQTPALAFVDPFLETHPNAQLYLVGGALRDTLLGRKMAEMDFDFVIRGLEADAVQTWFSTQGEINLVGQHFGVFKFMPRGYSSDRIAFIDLALPRTEAVAEGSLGGYKDFDVQSDPNLPIEDDLARRDFTMNAIAFDVRMEKLVDPFQGQTDLSQKIIRAVGNPEERFREDLTRMLRAIRFSAELGFTIEESTMSAIQTLMSEINRMREVDGKLEFVVPREIVGEELAKALFRNPSRATLILRDSGALKELFLGIQDVLAQKDYLEPFTRTQPNELLVVVALLMRGLSQEQLHNAIHLSGLDRLPRDSSIRIDVGDVLWLTKILQSDLSVHVVEGLPGSEFERQFMNGHGTALVRCLDVLDQKKVADAARGRRKEIENRWLVDYDETIAPLLSGNDVLAAGVPAGPKVRLWLDGIRDLQLDGRLMTREAALTWLKDNLPRE
ncbi:CCA tRNA nucleotidyltransferase [Candidatus Uhrbacteria bacterium]|nr:CCA tRNA nucleotidyltransferase [Candidatus Uhrbacteria bacterium]